MRASILIHMRKAFHPFHYWTVKKPSLHWDQKLSQNQRGVLSREARRSKKERMHKLAQKAGAKKGKLGPASKEGLGEVRLSEHGIQNETNDRFLWEGMCFIFHIECFWEKDLKEKGGWFYLPGSYLFQSRIWSIWLFHLMSRYTMGTFVIFKLSPSLNDHLLYWTMEINPV